MTEVDELLRRYKERFESGGPVDARDLLSEVEGRERAELSALIDGYLELEAPGQDWDPEAFEGSISDRAVARVAESWSGASGELPHTLADLRNERQVKRRDVVQRLAEALGVASAEEKVGRYYHQLEHGMLPAESVSSRVFQALGEILDTTADTLRRAGESVAPSAGGEPGPVMARMAPRSAGPANAAPPPTEQHKEEPAEDADWDEVDRLFRGGD